MTVVWQNVSPTRWQELPRNIGAVEAQAVAANLESSVRDNDPLEQTQVILKRFADIIEPLTAQLKAAFGETPDAGPVGPAAATDPTSLKPIVEKLVALLKDYDSLAVDYAESVRGELVSILGFNEYSHFEKALTAYDFDEALMCLKDTTKKLNVLI